MVLPLYPVGLQQHQLGSYCDTLGSTKFNTGTKKVSFLSTTVDTQKGTIPAPKILQHNAHDLLLLLINNNICDPRAWTLSYLELPFHTQLFRTKKPGNVWSSVAILKLHEQKTF